MKQTSVNSILTLREVRKLINSVDNARDKLMIRLLYETGCELIELVNIKVSDILGNKIKIIDDNKKIRFPQISSKLAKDIRMYVLGNNLSKSMFLFSTRQSKNISEKRVRQLIQQYSQKYCSKKINPQNFRYFHIAHAYLNGVLLETISKQLGITTNRIFQILNDLNLKANHNYNKFLNKV